MKGYSLEDQKNSLDVCIEGWEKAINDWEIKALHAAEVDGFFKSFEAASKKAICDGQKISAVMAEAAVRSQKEWKDRYISVQQTNIEAEKAKRILRLAEAKWETERSKEVSLRNLK
tara:strand:- start:4692 stop:5039 length:348 start_codon:yes stop_codon:yes gene_type:complete